MRKLAVTLALSLLLLTSGCAFMKSTGTAICAAEEELSVQITNAGNQLGFLGAAPLVAEVLNTTLGLFCTVLDAGLSAPADLSDAVGLTTPEPEAPPDEDPEG